MGLMATWADAGLDERSLRTRSLHRFGVASSEAEQYALPLGDVERAEILLASTFLHKPFPSLSAWKKSMEAHGFSIFFNFESLQRHTSALRWVIEAQVYITNGDRGAIERKFVRTLRVESTDPLDTDLSLKRGNRRRRNHR